MSLADLTIYKQKETLGIPKGMTAVTEWVVTMRSATVTAEMITRREYLAAFPSREKARHYRNTCYCRHDCKITPVLIICVVKE